MTQFYPSYSAETAFQPSRFNAVVLAESKRTKVILACFEPGPRCITQRWTSRSWCSKGKGRWWRGRKKTNCIPERLPSCRLGRRAG